MDRDRIQGKAREIKGKVQDAWGKVTGDIGDRAKGKGNQIAGQAQQAAGKVKDEFRAEKERQDENDRNRADRPDVQP